MGLYKGRVREIRLDANGRVEISIVCPTVAVPSAGQYLVAVDRDDLLATLGTPIFTVESTSHGCWAAPLQSVAWNPGTNLELAGPLGRGFDLPSTVQRLGLIAMGETVSRLMPLVQKAGQFQASITLFTDLHLPKLPMSVEVHPLISVKNALDWPDFIAIDLPLERLDELRTILGVPGGAIMPCPTQVLVSTPMPCAGMAQCGVCAIHGRKGWKLACQDGPVFDLVSLNW